MIVQFTVVEDELHIFTKLIQTRVLLLLQLSLNRAEVHRLLDNIIVVGNVKRFDINWLLKDPS